MTTIIPRNTLLAACIQAEARQIDAEQAADEAIEQFNNDMSSATEHGERRDATEILARRLGDTARAEACYEAWMIQQQRTQIEIRSDRVARGFRY